jgi:hypothetical protein
MNIHLYFYCEITAPEDLNYPILQIHYKGANGIRTISPVGIFSGWFFSLPYLREAATR